MDQFRSGRWLALLLTPALALAGCVSDSLSGPSSLDAADAQQNAGDAAAIVFLAQPDGSRTFQGSGPLASGLIRYAELPSWEPTIGIAADGSMFVSASEAVPVNYGRSRDQGLTWQVVTAPTNVASNDPYVHVDPTTDRVFTNDLLALTCSQMHISDDLGENWITSPIGCGAPPGVHDHQTIGTGMPRVLPTAGYDNLVYYCVNRLVDSACSVSQNGGLSFGPLIPVFNPAAAGCGGLHGHVKSAPDGTTYLAKSDCGGRVVIGRTVDDGMTWTVHTVHPESGSGHEANIAIDQAGNVYVIWMSADRQPLLAVSEDAGQSWSAPVSIGHPGLDEAWLPAITAGAEGAVAFAYVGTPDSDVLEWHAYLGTIYDALADGPQVTSLRLTPADDPITKGPCASRCAGVGDFIDIDTDLDGRPWAVFVDSCRAACLAEDATGPEPRSESSVFVGTLGTGASLYGGWLAPLAP